MTTHRSLTPGSRLGRREFLRLAGLGAGAAALAACAPAATPTAAPTAAGAPTTAAPTAAAGQVTISFWTPGGSETFCKGFDTIGENFTKVEPGILVTKECNAGGVNDYNTVLQAAIAAGNPPDSTIIWTSPVTYAAVKAVEPLDDLMAGSKYSQVQNWPPAVLASCLWQGKVYGLPVAAGSYGIFYNQEAFDAKGIPSDRASFPKTWDDLKKLSAEFVKWEGDTLVSAGLIPWNNNVLLNIWSALNGSQLYDSASGKYTIDSEQNIGMMQYALDWLNEQYKGDWVKMQASDNWGGYADSNGRAPAFQNGNLAMNVEGFWFTGDMYGAEFKGWSKWNVAPFPVGPSGSKSVSGYWPNWLVIPKGSKHVAEAFKYLDYMSAEGIKVWFANVPDLPTNKLVPTDLIPQLVLEKRGQEFGADVTAFFHAQLDVATPMWNSPVVEFAHDQVGKAANAILNKTSSPKDALSAAQQASQAELERVLKSVS
jgi:multiple sugar transport system substrate-binding protein